MEARLSKFAAALHRQLSAKDDLTRRERRLLELLERPPSRRQAARLRVLEARAALTLGRAPEEIDWDKVRVWVQIIAAVLSIFLMVL